VSKILFSQSRPEKFCAQRFFLLLCFTLTQPLRREFSASALQYRLVLRRLLNIASIVCLVLCVALIGMWVRSYRTDDELPKARVRFFLFAVDGRLLICDGPFAVAGFYPSAAGYWQIIIYTGMLPQQRLTLGGSGRSHGFGFDHSANASVLMLPFCIVVLSSGFLAMLFQLRWPSRFTLRGLFIATTFLAVVLGMIAWLDQAWIGK
jgi:hypothetical protein